METDLQGLSDAQKARDDSSAYRVTADGACLLVVTLCCGRVYRLPGGDFVKMRRV